MRADTRLPENVLMDGQRSTAKTDDLKSILERIPTPNVERIDVISGNYSNENMEGHTVVAHVTQKIASSTNIIASASTNIWPDGNTNHDFNLKYTNTNGDWRYEGSIERVPNYDDTAGTGSSSIVDFPGLPTRQRITYRSSVKGWIINGTVDMPLFEGPLRSNLKFQNNPNCSLLRHFSSLDAQNILDDSYQNNFAFGTHWTH